MALDLRRATDLAREHAPGTPGHALAWRRAEHATHRLADLVDVTTPLEPMLLAAGARVRARAAGPGPRELGRRARAARS